MEGKDYEKRGYLREEFRLFHLRDESVPSVAYHYHEFHKLMLLQSGAVDYVVEGRRCLLEPGDLVLVPRGSIHRPEVHPGTAYERIIVYLSPDFLRRESGPDGDLETCFSPAYLAEGPVLRPAEGRRSALAGLLEAAGRAMEETGAFGRELLCRALLLQLLVELTRARTESRLTSVSAEARGRKSAEIMRYLGAHLAEEVTIDDLAERFFVSRYHMMRRFREDTGMTIHSYLLTKRLMTARDLMAAGMTATEACFACGCRDYSAFARAYRKRFGTAPRRSIAGALESGPKE